MGTGKALGVHKGKKRLNRRLFSIKDLFIHERQREKGRDTGRGRSRLHVGRRDSRIRPWAQGRCSTTEPPGGAPAPVTLTNLLGDISCSKGHSIGPISRMNEHTKGFYNVTCGENGADRDRTNNISAEVRPKGVFGFYQHSCQAVPSNNHHLADERG